VRPCLIGRFHASRRRDARVGAKKVYLPELRPRRTDELLGTLGVRNVAGYGQSTNLGGGLLGGSGIEVVDDHARGLGGRPPGQCPADPATAPGDDHVGRLQIHSSCSWYIARSPGLLHPRSCSATVRHLPGLRAAFGIPVRSRARGDGGRDRDGDEGGEDDLYEVEGDKGQEARDYGGA
jgi:hypothetical protein